MTTYQHFLDALEGSFEDFLQSNEVNTYLQTIGGEIKTETLHEGILYEFIVISGYENERDTWATAYNNQIRLGDEVIQVDGLDKPMVLTPNLFYGINQEDEEIEYRMGLIKTENRISLLPVVLRKTKDGIQAQILSDLCVIHRGIAIDSKTAERLGRKKVEEFTAYKQFLACFWNIDDYLRKQNPNFYSDFDIDVWRAVEVFSGRIIDQMLSKISHQFISNRETSNPGWIIPQAENFYLQRIMTWIEKCLDEPSEISENQIIYLVKNLCSYMCRFNNFKPLEILAAKDLNILPYVLNNLKTPRSEITNEAVKVFQTAVETLPIISPVVVPKILELLPDHNWRRLAIETLEKILEKNPECIDECISIIIGMLSDESVNKREAGLQAYRLILTEAQPTSFPKGLEKIVELLADRYGNVRNAALDVCKKAFRKIPRLIIQYVPTIVGMFTNECSDVRDGALRAYDATPPTLKVKSGTFPLILEMLTDNEDYTRKTALQAYIATITQAPELIDQKGVQKILDLLLDHQKEIRTIALDGYELIARQTPQFIPQSIPTLISMLLGNKKTIGLKTLSKIPNHISPHELDIIFSLFEDPADHIREIALETYKIAILKSPKLITRRGANKIILMLSDTATNVKVEALRVFMAVLSKTPQFMNQDGINTLLCLFSDPNEIVRKAALESYRTALIQTPQYIEQRGINALIEALSDQYWEVKVTAIDVYETAFKEAPQIIPQTIPKLLEMLTDQHWGVQVATLQAYTTALAKNPLWIDQTGINTLVEMFSSPNKFVKEAALEAYRIAIAKTPQYINQVGINRMLKLRSDQDPLVKQAASNTYEMVRLKMPHLIKNSNLL